MYARKRYIILTTVTALFINIMLFQNITNAASDREKQAINGELDKATQQMARILAAPAFRKFLSEETKASQNREQILILEDTITKARGRSELGLPRGILKELHDILTSTKTKMKNAHYQADFISFDLYFPVPDHRKEWDGEEKLLVSFFPIDDGKDIRSITAYRAKSGRKVSLDLDKIPDTPTLFIAIGEHIDHKPEKEVALDKWSEHYGKNYVNYVRNLQQAKPMQNSMSIKNHGSKHAL